jgi:hypothetical protein
MAKTSDNLRWCLLSLFEKPASINSSNINFSTIITKIRFLLLIIVTCIERKNIRLINGSLVGYLIIGSINFDSRSMSKELVVWGHVGLGTHTIRVWLIKSNPMLHSVSKFLEAYIGVVPKIISAHRKSTTNHQQSNLTSPHGVDYMYQTTS